MEDPNISEKKNKITNIIILLLGQTYPEFNNYEELPKSLRDKLSIIFDSMINYPEDVLNKLYQFLEEKNYGQQFNEIDKDLFETIDNLASIREFSNKPDKDIFQELKDNLTTLQINTILINCHKIIDESDDDKVKELIYKLIQDLTKKMSSLNELHNIKRIEGNVIGQNGGKNKLFYQKQYNKYKSKYLSLKNNF